MSRPRSIYVLSLSNFIFSLLFTVTNHMTSLKQTHLLFEHFLECLLHFWRITCMKKADNSQLAKVQSHVVAWLLLNFLPISVWHYL